MFQYCICKHIKNKDRSLCILGKTHTYQNINSILNTKLIIKTYIINTIYLTILWNNKHKEIKYNKKDIQVDFALIKSKPIDWASGLQQAKIIYFTRISFFYCLKIHDFITMIFDTEDGKNQ